MTAKAESPPANGNEMKVLRRTLCFWSNGASALGFTFITDIRDLNGILMIRNTPGLLEMDVFLFQVLQSLSEPTCAIWQLRRKASPTGFNEK